MTKTEIRSRRNTTMTGIVREMRKCPEEGMKEGETKIERKRERERGKAERKN